MKKQNKPKTQSRNQQREPFKNTGGPSNIENKQPVPQPKDYEDIEY